MIGQILYGSKDEIDYQKLLKKYRNYLLFFLKEKNTFFEDVEYLYYVALGFQTYYEYVFPKETTDTLMIENIIFQISTMYSQKKETSLEEDIYLETAMIDIKMKKNDILKNEEVLNMLLQNDHQIYESLHSRKLKKTYLIKNLNITL